MQEGDSYFQLNRTLPPPPFIPFHPHPRPRRKLECTNEESEGMELSTSLWLPIDSVSMATGHVSEPFAAPPPRCTRPPSRRKGFWVA
ncbi:hypothetical protein CEXT_725471 [Caerostris extrusa]|uniref:Uncharacterized protein n=1 Tax=Caerostris extrusa TaxID=172846 RepID=A0AAV4Y8K4_CAEEX|nr:hypothetical protein CEXT_725471 [Caerostris extrusa]